MTDYITREGRVGIFLAHAKPPTFELAWGCMIEECGELAEAARRYAEFDGVISLVSKDRKNKTQARADLVKEMADVQYVLSQLAIFYDINLEEAFDRVALNNMTKVVGGEIKYREDGKILKPDNYKKPDMKGL